MGLLAVEPHELEFTFELKKQSSCLVQLLNNSEEYVAFKVKTTSPKKYSVRPNTGIIQPKSRCDFTVIMQAQREAPPNLQCKDKFLVQSTVVSAETAIEDITSNMFSKDTGKYIEENKLTVLLVAPPVSPVLLPLNGALKPEPSNGSPILGDQENLPPVPVVEEDAKVLQLAKNEEKLKLSEDLEDLKLVNKAKELKSKLTQLKSELIEAETTIRGLTDERNRTIKEKEILQEELVILRRNAARRVKVGFPFLFVCLVALVSLALGYLLH